LSLSCRQLEKALVHASEYLLAIHRFHRYADHPSLKARLNNPLPTHSVLAFNLATASENKIHDDTVARRFGFRGALVPGVEVFATMVHVPAAHIGRARGRYD